MIDSWFPRVLSGENRASQGRRERRYWQKNRRDRGRREATVRSRSPPGTGSPFASGGSDVWAPGVIHLHDSAMPDRPARARSAGLLLLLTPVIWGATFPAAKVALRDVSPWTFVAWSRGLGLLAVLVVMAVWRPPRAVWSRGLVPAGL